MRLVKAIATAGVASRRKAEEIIAEGKVTVDGKVERNPATFVDFDKNTIAVNGRKLRPRPAKLVYIALHKPPLVMSTTSDPHNRTTVIDLVPKRKGIRLYPVGRLDFKSSGLILLTNDGDLAQAVAHPKSRQPRTYLVKVSGKPNEKAINRMRKGVRIDGKKSQPAWVEETYIKAGPKRTNKNSWLKITIHEGRNRQIRKMCDAVGHMALKVKRVSIGNVKLGKLPIGNWRHLKSEEIEGLIEPK